MTDFERAPDESASQVRRRLRRAVAAEHAKKIRGVPAKKYRPPAPRVGVEARRKLDRELHKAALRRYEVLCTPAGLFGHYPPAGPKTSRRGISPTKQYWAGGPRRPTQRVHKSSRSAKFDGRCTCDGVKRRIDFDSLESKRRICTSCYGEAVAP